MTANKPSADDTHWKLTKPQEVLIWGTGLFENDADAHIMRDFVKEVDGAEKGLTSFLYLDSEKALEYRRKLDAGALDRLLEKRLPIHHTSVLANYNKTNTTWTWPPERCPGYHLCLLGAAMMRLGCVIRPDFRQSLEELYTKVGFSRNAQVQFRHALNIYVDGIPYNFRDKPRPIGLDQDDTPSNRLWGDISECLIDLGDDIEPGLKMISRMMFGPLLKCAAAGDNEHPQNACGNCGKKKAADGSPCRPCSDCGQRLYCSRKCELAHRHMHKLICKDPFYRTMGNLWARSRDAVDAANAQRELPGRNQDDLATDEANDSESGKYEAPTIPALAIALGKAERARQRGLPVLPGESTSASISSDCSSDEENSLLHCGNCGTEAALDRPHLLCKKCGEQHYCSKKCQKADWPKHKKRCLTSTSA